MALVLNHSRSKGTDKLILVGIANHDGDGGAWPSIATLARYGGCSESTVHRAIRELVALGELRVHLQDGGTHRTPARYRPNRYEILIDPSAPAVTGEPEAAPEDPHTGVSPAAPLSETGVSPVRGRGVIPAPSGVPPAAPEPSLQPPMELKADPARFARSPSTPPGAREGHVTPATQAAKPPPTDGRAASAAAAGTLIALGPEHDPDALAADLAEGLADAIGTYASRRPKPTAHWVKAMRRLLDRENVTEEQLRHVIEHLPGDGFWTAHIFTASKFAQKYDQILNSARRAWRPARPGTAAADNQQMQQWMMAATIADTVNGNGSTNNHHHDPTGFPLKEIAQ